MTVEPISVVAPPLTRPHLLRQCWCDVAFLHWAVDPEVVAGLMPPGVRPDVFDGCTYVGLVPFRMVGTGFAIGPAAPWAGTFLETNVRLYSVDATGRRGVVPWGRRSPPPPAEEGGSARKSGQEQHGGQKGAEQHGRTEVRLEEGESRREGPEAQCPQETLAR